MLEGFNSSVGILVVRTILARVNPPDFGGFNSSVGILVVRTQLLEQKRSECVRFNSSVGILVVRTSLITVPPNVIYRCFNSSVGILVVRTWATTRAARPRQWLKCARFNSSVGILVVRTSTPSASQMNLGSFQFLGRNSGRSDENNGDDLAYPIFVSIPRSEFWSFGREYAHAIVVSGI